MLAMSDTSEELFIMIFHALKKILMTLDVTGITVVGNVVRLY